MYVNALQPEQMNFIKIYLFRVRGFIKKIEMKN